MFPMLHRTVTGMIYDYEIILQNIETIGGIPIDYLNYSSETNKPIFSLLRLQNYRN